MTKHQKLKAPVQTDARPRRVNGKAFKKDMFGPNGRRLTGRCKPSGNSIGGHAVSKIRKVYPTPEAFAARVEEIKASRNTQHRAALRRERQATAVKPCTNVHVKNAAL